ncbi:hypothetical protein SAMD00019534_048580 [Acytostelium subglobosum LB1]|uniref:hypothetical protein n=1 Tax=Acytostelium subglobosum LB1 TaxID=1410327 RepID=UPI0006448AF7|nr:hypothetical protein SAMD00019534_048580 [Acytostelium subglobosum LB1]GAM21683.1 hypothetical protein SAMD00019534_048580 [Acytostelium subglobosum LB1]|eukprot:XP_012755802.1 hypothetical protein SAMD00019534_048580 [Acytostelium subglobosum LB1]
MTDVQLVSVFQKLRKIVEETQVYCKRVDFLKENGLPIASNNNLFEEDDDLLFPLEIGNEMYLKALTVYQQHKTFIENIEKSINKCVDKIGKNERSKSIANHLSATTNSSSSSSDEDTEKQDKRTTNKRKTMSSNSSGGGSLTQKIKRVKQPTEPPSNGATAAAASSTTTTTTSTSSTTTTESPITEAKEVSPTTSQKSTPAGAPAAPAPSAATPESIPIGTQVAAKDRSNNWILAKVNSFNAKTQKYELIDEDEAESKKFTVSLKDIIQLPTTAALANTFATNTKVLAMFPDTTTFYPALVVGSQKIKNKTTQYTLHFDDDAGENGQTPNRKVAAQYVILKQ